MSYQPTIPVLICNPNGVNHTVHLPFQILQSMPFTGAQPTQGQFGAVVPANYPPQVTSHMAHNPSNNVGSFQHFGGNHSENSESRTYEASDPLRKLKMHLDSFHASFLHALQTRRAALNFKNNAEASKSPNKRPLDEVEVSNPTGKRGRGIKYACLKTDHNEDDMHEVSELPQHSCIKQDLQNAKFSFPNANNVPIEKQQFETRVPVSLPIEISDTNQEQDVEANDDSSMNYSLNHSIHEEQQDSDDSSNVCDFALESSSGQNASYLQQSQTRLTTPTSVNTIADKEVSIPIQQQPQAMKSATPSPENNAIPLLTIEEMLLRTRNNYKKLECPCSDCVDGTNKINLVRKHACPIYGCNKTFVKPCYLVAHLNGHSGYKPFTCDWYLCEKGFGRRDELRRHRRIHTGERRYKCSECDKQFQRSDHLLKHKKALHKDCETDYEVPINTMSDCHAKMLIDQYI